MTTELEAVNEIITQAGYTKITTVGEITSVAEASDAKDILDRISREEQSKGYYFNSEDKVEITLDGSGEYTIPSDILRIDPYYQYKKYVQRAGKLYDIEDQTSVLGNSGDTIEVNLVRLIDFADLPETAKRYILKRAQRTYLTRYHGEPMLLEIAHKDELEAKAAFDADNFESSDFNMLDNCDNGDVYNGYL
jgi:hypothetical protein